ncbi:MAG: PadR family transcriptional regulator [Desulfobacterales bacterium]|nr:PadR family transcriptional regulator [Desulfobacterales bacterium]
MIEMMLLGFLMDGDKTGYEIKKYMENSTHYFFNTGFGSIYPKFKKLEKEGCVLVSEKVKNGKLNKAYALTDKGRQTFLDWLEIKPEIGRIRDEAVLKVFFFDYLEEDKVTSQLDAYINDLKRQVEALQAIKERFSSRGIEPWKMKTLDFGIQYYDFLEQRFSGMRPAQNSDDTLDSISVPLPEKHHP